MLLSGCSEQSEQNTSQEELTSQDTAAVVFGPSLTEMFFVSGAWNRVAGVDRFSTWPPEVQDLAVVGDFLTPSMEMITALGATSIHVIGTNQSLKDLSGRLGIPYYQYSFDRLADVYSSCDTIENLYPEADFGGFREEIETTLDSLYSILAQDSLRVMIVVFLDADGSATVAGQGTFFADIISGMGCVTAAPEAGSYPAVSVEGILSLAPDRIVIMDPYHTGETNLDLWRESGLEDTNVRVLTGDYVLVPGARLHELIVGIAQCLN